MSREVITAWTGISGNPQSVKICRRAPLSEAGRAIGGDSAGDYGDSALN
jgi:hypothetical protein